MEIEFDKSRSIFVQVLSRDSSNVNSKQENKKTIKKNILTTITFFFLDPSLILWYCFKNKENPFNWNNAEKLLKNVKGYAFFLSFQCVSYF